MAAPQTKWGVRSMGHKDDPGDGKGGVRGCGGNTLVDGAAVSQGFVQRNVQALTNLLAMVRNSRAR